MFMYQVCIVDFFPQWKYIESEMLLLELISLVF